MYTSIKLKSAVVLTVFNFVILNADIKINDINGKIGALCATFKWAIGRNVNILHKQRCYCHFLPTLYRY
nr:MAG TPA: hypothetical protein [Caudoviricetes sp.]